MFGKSTEIKYYSFALANLMAAFGGGMILGKGASVIECGFLKNGSLLAFFIGAVLGISFLQLVPKRIANKLAK